MPFAMLSVRLSRLWPGWRGLDRSNGLSLVISVAVAIITIQSHALLTPATLSSLVSYAATKYGGHSPPVFSLIHHRPMEVCDTYVADKTARMTAIHQQYAGSTELSGSLAALRAFDADASDLLLAPCRGKWIWQPGSGAHLFAQFARDAWAAWLFDRFGITDAWAVVLTLAGVILGAFGLSRIAYFLTGSNVIAALTLTGVLAIDRALTPWFAQVILGAWYGFSTAWLIMALVRPQQRSSLSMAWLVPTLSINLLGYLAVAHSSAFLAVAVPLLICGVAVAAAPGRARVASFAVIAAIVLLGLFDCSRFVRRQLAPISSANFASAGSFGEFALTTGFWTERPNPWSYPLGDVGVFAAVASEPLVWASAPASFEYQGFSLLGRDLLAELLVEHPLLYLENLWKRCALLVWRLPTIIRTTYRIVPWAIDAAQALAPAALLVAIVALFRRRAWATELPIVGIALWNFFGIEGLTHLVHTHMNYFVVGLLQLVLLGPLLVILLGRQSATALAAYRQWRATTRTRITVAVGFLLAFLLVGLYASREVRQELATFDIWYQPWLGKDVRPVKSDLLPDVIAARLEGLRHFGEPSPGSISMYGAWTMSRLALEVWVPSLGDRLAMTAAEVETERKRAEQYAVHYFRQAQAEAPDDPWVGTFAWILDPASAPALYSRALERSTDGPFSAWFAKYLYNTIPNGQKYGDLFEELTHTRLVRGAHLRPGFLEVPTVGHPTSANVRIVDQQLHITLKPGESIDLGAADGFRTDRVKAFLYARLTAGSAEASLLLGDGRTTVVTGPQNLTPVDGSRYRFFTWNGDMQVETISIRLTAGTAGAELAVRDFHPIIENPRRDAR